MSNTVFDALREIDPDAYAAMEFVARECIGQREREGWTPERDDKHAHGEMALAAMGYIQVASARDYATNLPPPRYWPWDASWWKPKSPWRDLTRSAALVIAEMGRRIRARTSPAPRPGDKEE